MGYQTSLNLKVIISIFSFKQNMNLKISNFGGKYIDVKISGRFWNWIAFSSGGTGTRNGTRVSGTRSAMEKWFEDKFLNFCPISVNIWSFFKVECTKSAVKRWKIIKYGIKNLAKNEEKPCSTCLQPKFSTDSKYQKIRFQIPAPPSVSSLIAPLWYSREQIQKMTILKTLLGLSDNASPIFFPQMILF